MMRTFLLVSFFIYKANAQIQNTSSTFEVETSYIDGEISEGDKTHVVFSIDEICVLFNISTENCTCEVVSAYIPDLPMCASSNEQIKNTSSAFKDETSYIGGEISEGDKTHVVFSIDEICVLFNISTENCTCEVVSAYIPDLPMCASSNEQIQNTSSAFKDETSYIGGEISEGDKTHLVFSIDEMCVLFNISTENCTCEVVSAYIPDLPICTSTNEQIQNTSSAFKVETSYIDGEISEEDKKHLVISIGEICVLFNFSKENCTCEVVSAYIPDLPMCASSNELVYDPTTSSVYATVTIIASLIGGFGNFGILVVAYKQRNGLPRSNVLFAQLAIVDFTFAVIQTIVVIPLFRTNRWVFGPFFCKFFRAAMAMGGHLTIGFILNITIERFLGIIYPLKTKRTSKKTTFCLTISNIVAGFLTITPLLAVLRIDHDDGRCIEHWDDFSANESVYNWFLLIVYFLIPVIIIFALYGRIIKHLKGQEKINNSLYIESERQKKLKRNQRIMYIIVSILIAFIVCILPNRAIWIYLDYRKNKIDQQLFMILSFISYVSYPFHVAFNPIIYSMIDKNWRRDIVNVFCCRKVGNYRMSKSSTATIQTSSITSQDLRTSMMRTKLSIISDKDWESRTHLMVCREGQRNKEESTTI